MFRNVRALGWFESMAKWKLIGCGGLFIVRR